MGRNIYSPEYQAFLSLLREAREHAGLTQADAAYRLGKPQSYISKSESGERRVDVVEAKHFAEIYGVPLSKLIEGGNRDDGDAGDTCP